MSQMNCQSAVLRLNNKMANELTAGAQHCLTPPFCSAGRAAALSLARPAFYRRRFVVILGVWAGLSKRHSSQFRVLFWTLFPIFTCALGIDRDKYTTAAAPNWGEYSPKSLQVLLRCFSLVKAVSAVRMFSGAVCSFFAIQQRQT